MIEYREIPENDMIELKIDGYITAEDFHSIAEKLLLFMDQHKKIRVLKEVRSFSGLDFVIFKERLIGAWLKHFKDVGGVAVVCDEHWMEQLTELLKPIYPYPVRCFKPTNIEEARSWLKSI